MKKIFLSIFFVLTIITICFAAEKSLETYLGESSAITSMTGTDLIFPMRSGVIDQITWANVLTSLASTFGTSVEIDAHTAQSLTAAQLVRPNGTTIHNYNQAASNINNTLPTTAANLAFMGTVATAQASNYWRFTAASAGTIYLNGSATGKDYVQYAAPAVGNYFSCFTANRGGAYVWYCTDGVGSLSTN